MKTLQAGMYKKEQPSNSLYIIIVILATDTITRMLQYIYWLTFEMRRKFLKLILLFKTPLISPMQF